jgi:hypothetical protein
MNIIEDITISFFPQAPSSNHEDSHEERKGEQSPCQMNLMQKVSVRIPNNTKREPPADISGAIKEQVLHCFLSAIQTQCTVVSFLMELVSSF